MMQTDDQFAVMIGRAVLETADAEIQLEVLDAMGEDAGTVPLGEQLKEAKTAGRQAGDFGMEILNPMIYGNWLFAMDACE
ncbi:MAG: hypothetical protein JWQ66_4458 [Mucilaginibacter sp.]|nr:hypothetical protein [Mucilaginibacter sp.]